MIFKETLLSLDIVIDNKYLDKYIELIQGAKFRKYKKGETQKHHIIPRAYFKENSLPIDNTNNNLVNLYYYEHILSHWYLYKCAKQDYFIYSNCYALLYMLRINKLPETENDIITHAINYGEVYADFCHRQSARYKGKPGKTKGRKASEELRKKLSEAHKGKNRDEESKQKQSETLKDLWNTKWKDRKIPDDVKQRISNTVKSLVYIHKDMITKHVKPEEVEAFLANGWQLGSSPALLEKRSKQFTEYNKNKIISDATRKKMSESAKNRDPKTRSHIGKPYTVMNNGLINKHVFNDTDCKLLESQGFIYGTIKQTIKSMECSKIKQPRKTNKGKINIKNQHQGKMINKEELEYYLNQGWERGIFRNDNKNNVR